MAIRDLFLHGRNIPKKSLNWKKHQNNLVMKEFLNNLEIAQALDKPGERAELHEVMRDMAEDGLSKEEMKRALGKFMAGRGRTISRKEGYEVAKEIFPDEKQRYILPDNRNAATGGEKEGVAEKNNRSGPARQLADKKEAMPASLGKLPGLAASVYRPGSRDIRGRNVQTGKGRNNIKDEDSFFHAMRTTIKNNPSRN